MVKVINNERFVCDLCNKTHPSATAARTCEDGHDIVYVAFERSDLKRLLLFLNTGEQSLLTKTLYETLNRYASMRAER